MRRRRGCISGKRKICLRGKGGGVFGAGILIAVAVLVRLLSGSPVLIWGILRRNCPLPPLFVFHLLVIVLSGCIGFACGLVLSAPGRACESDKYCGGMFCVLLCVFWFIAYPLTFRAGLFLLTLLDLCIVAFLTFLCMLLFSRIRRLAGGIMLAVLVGVVYLLLLILMGILFL